MTNKQSKKIKKPLHTSLGKAPSQVEKVEIDLSQVRPPIETNIKGLREIISLYQTATEEVKSYITYECDVMYECKRCRNIFRSIANFIHHKRNYCQTVRSLSSNCREVNILDTLQPPNPPRENAVLNPAYMQSGSSSEKGLNPVIEKLKEKQEIQIITEELLCADLSKEDENNETTTTEVSENYCSVLEKTSSKNAVFQTVLKSVPSNKINKRDLMKNEVLEIHGIMDSKNVVLDADGKVSHFDTNKLNRRGGFPKSDLVCCVCSLRFSSKKTLSFHLKTKHNDSRLVYICPDCKETFANPWSVYRHLYKVHRRTASQVKKLREQIHSSVIRKDASKKIEKKDSLSVEKADDENQWLTNIEGDNDLQMCGGCGKRFERKAALQSHAAICSKRLAVCNTIKENNAKKKEEESKDMKNKAIKASTLPNSETIDNVLKGSAKRKPYLLRMYKQKSHTTSNVINPCAVDSVPTVNHKKEVGVKQEYAEDRETESNENVSSCVPINDICDNSPEKNISDDLSYSDETKKGCDVSNCDNSVLLRKDAKDSSPQDKKSTKKVTSSMSLNNVELRRFKVESQTQYDFNVSLNNLNDESQNTNTSEGEENMMLSEFVENEDPTAATDNQNISVDCASPGKISIRSLEELRGFPKESEDSNVDKEMPILTPCVSSKTPKKSQKRLAKRKRTSFEDLQGSSKTLKKCTDDALVDKQDLSFMVKATPYMDRSTLTCKSCQIKYSSLSKLLWHMSAHFSWFRFQCSRCYYVSFSKSDCSNHAKEIHNIKKSEISGVVLPIPNWKTQLLSEDFKELKNEDNYTGNDTDEVEFSKSGPTSAESNEIDSSQNLINTLFVDSDIDEANWNLPDVETSPLPVISKNVSAIKNEITDSIDIENIDDEDNFQVEVPQEIYTLNIFEVINEDELEENRRQLSTKQEEIDDFISPNCSGAVTKFSESTENVNNSASKVVNVRPTRNRMRSIKTLQDDFFYDLGKIPKQHDLVNKSNGSQKSKKNYNLNIVKKEK